MISSRRSENSKAFTLGQIIAEANKDNKDFANWLQDRKNLRAIPHRFEQVGYTAVRNTDAKSGRWRVDRVKFGPVTTPKGGKVMRAVDIVTEKQMIYAASTLSVREQLRVRRRPARRGNEKGQGDRGSG